VCTCARACVCVCVCLHMGLYMFFFVRVHGRIRSCLLFSKVERVSQKIQSWFLLVISQTKEKTRATFLLGYLIWCLVPLFHFDFGVGFFSWICCFDIKTKNCDIKIKKSNLNGCISHIYVYIYMYIYIHTCVYICILIYICIYKSIFIYIYIYICVICCYIHICRCIYTDINICIFTYMYIHT